jgi:hypothetical protein
MRQRFPTTGCRRTLTLLDLVGLATLLVLSGGALAGEGTSQAGDRLPGHGPLTERTVELTDEDVHSLGKASRSIVPKDLAGAGISFIADMGSFAPGGYLLNIVSSLFTPSTRVFVAADEAGVFTGTLFTIANITPDAGVVRVVVFVQANHVSRLFLRGLLIN